MKGGPRRFDDNGAHLVLRQRRLTTLQYLQDGHKKGQRLAGPRHGLGRAAVASAHRRLPGSRYIVGKTKEGRNEGRGAGVPRRQRPCW
jgi:hypothetical protein